MKSKTLSICGSPCLSEHGALSQRLAGHENSCKGGMVEGSGVQGLRSRVKGLGVRFDGMLFTTMVSAPPPHTQLLIHNSSQGFGMFVTGGGGRRCVYCFSFRYFGEGIGDDCKSDMEE